MGGAAARPRPLGRRSMGPNFGWVPAGPRTPPTPPRKAREGCPCVISRPCNAHSTPSGGSSQGSRLTVTHITTQFWQTLQRMIRSGGDMKNTEAQINTANLDPDAFRRGGLAIEAPTAITDRMHALLVTRADAL